MGRIRFCFFVCTVYIGKRCTLVNEQFAYRSLIIGKVQKKLGLLGLGLVWISNALRAVGRTLGCTNFKQALAFVYLCTWGGDEAMP